MTALPPAKTDLEARRALEAALLRRRQPGGPGPAAAAVPSAAVPSAAVPSAAGNPAAELSFRASLGQEGMWESLHGGFGSTPPMITGGLRLRGPLDPDAVARAWNAVVARHDNLRSRLRPGPDGLRLIVAPALELPVPVSEVTEQQFGDFVRREIDRPVDLTRGPLARLHLLRLGPDDHIALLLLPHLIGDGRSVEIIVAELVGGYLGAPAGPALPLHYGEFAARHRSRVEGSRGAEVIAYWRERLHGAEPAVLPTDRRLTGPPSRLGGLLEVELPPSAREALHETARRERTTLHTVGLAAFQVLLARRSGQRDICVRAPVSYRDDTDVHDVVADFSNDVVVRTDLSATPDFRRLISALHRRTTADFAHHDVPAHLLEPHLGEPGLLDRLFHVQFTTERDLDAPARLGPLEVRQYLPPDPYVSRPLSLRLRYDERRTRCLVTYAEDWFSRARVEEFTAAYLALIEEVAAAPDGPLFP